ncbi:hypothetical protein KR009_010834 [Drosophila setifemur]|nr:hypothetical protein KR009_010834 [Drosophila setifemur]
MDAFAECNHSVNDLVTHLATLLAAEELAPNLPTAAAVTQRRSRIYEALIRGGTMPLQSKLELMWQVRCELQRDPKEVACLTSLQERLEGQSKAEQPEKEDAENQAEIKVPSKVLQRPRPFQLLNPEPNWDHDEQPKELKSLDQMLRAIKPLQLKPYSDLLLSNLHKKPPKKPHVVFEPTIVMNSAIAESLRRMREAKMRSLNPQPRLPILKNKPVPQDQKEPEFLVPPAPEKHFFSDHLLSNELKLHLNKDLVLEFIDEAILMDHLKNAAVGLQSETVIRDPENIHRLILKPNTTIRTVLPEVLADFADAFLRSGTAFLRLTSRTKCNKIVLAHLERPVNRAMRKAVRDFLANSREFLLSVSPKNLYELLRICQPALRLLQELDLMFENQPSLNFDTEVTGPFLLTSIWTAIDSCSNSTFLQLLIYLLRCVCQTYFVHLQRWIHRGELDETMNEIFISRSLNHSPLRVDEFSKEFFDRGYQVVNDDVPGFLVGCEEDILHCGKYNLVIKSYKAQHPVFDVEFPELEVCLGEHQLKKMRRNLAEKYGVIYQNFGWCSMQSLFEERMAAKRRFGNLMFERTQAHLIAWEEHQRVLLLEANAQKKLRYDELNEQQEQQQKIRLEQRRQHIVQELLLQKDCNLLNEQRLEREKNVLLKEIAQLKSNLDLPKEKVPSEVQKEKVLTEVQHEKDPPEVSSPDQSTISDRSFVSCQEGSESVLEINYEGSEADHKEEEEAAVGQLPNMVEYHRSHSDVLNSNEQPSHSEHDRNRQHILSSDQFQTWVNLKQTDSETSTGSSLATGPSDINANLAEEEITELQRNRLRNQNHDAFSRYNATYDEHTERIRCQMASETERARNRRRVMDSEYDIIVGDRVNDRKGKTMHLPLELHKLHVEVPQLVLTPMSTTSDVDIGGLSPIKETPQPTDKDATNNNNQSIKSSHSPLPKPFILRIPEELSDNPKPTFDLPTNGSIKSAIGEKKDTELGVPMVPKDCNPFMVRRCLQLSVMAPLNAHYALLRNEVLRIFQELRIYDHFRMLRNYFFLDGQFGGLLTSDILERIRAGIDPRSLCQKGVLDAMLSNALAASPTDETTVSQNLTLNCTQIPETLNYLSAEATTVLMLHCKVDWPLNLVISPETISKYGHIFAYLLKLRHVSFVLEGTYEHLQQMGKLLGPELRTAQHFRHLQMARHKLSHFVTSLQTHLVAKALLASWTRFKEQLCLVNSIEGLYQEHVAYLKRVAFLAHLNRRSAKVKETIDNILVIVLRFCKVLQSQSFIMDEENQFVHPRFKRLQQEETEFQKFMQYLIYLGNKAASSGYQEEIGDLISIINFNNYYKVSVKDSVS